MEAHSGGLGGFISAFAPMMLVSLLFSVTGFFIARRKVQNYWAWTIFCALPFLGWPVIPYLISMTDKAVYDQLARIEKLLDAS